jgi:hypothetical protein
MEGNQREKWKENIGRAEGNPSPDGRKSKDGFIIISTL